MVTSSNVGWTGWNALERVADHCTRMRARVKNAMEWNAFHPVPTGASPHPRRRNRGLRSIPNCAQADQLRA